MKFITYADYLAYSRVRYGMHLEEESEVYKLNKKQNCEVEGQVEKTKIDNKHDKMFRNILSSTKEMANFLNQFLKTKKKIEAEDLVQCHTDFVTKQYKDIRSDIIYRFKDKPIYFLVEHQSSIDKKMPYRMFEYAGEIIRMEKFSQKKYLDEDSYPIVIPIIIYTGLQKWNIQKNFKQEIFEMSFYDRCAISLKYNLVAIQDYTFEELLENKTLFSSIMIIEKCKTAEELNKYMNKIIEIIKDPKDKEKLLEIVMYVVSSIIGEDIVNQMVKKINEEEEEDMSPVQKMLLDLKEEYLRKGENVGIVKTVKGMLQFGEKDEKIMKYTGISKKELENIKGKTRV